MKTIALYYWAGRIGHFLSFFTFLFRHIIPVRLGLRGRISGILLSKILFLNEKNFPQIVYSSLLLHTEEKIVNQNKTLLCVCAGIIPLDSVSVRPLPEDEDRDRPWQLEIYNEAVQATSAVVKGCKLDKTGAVVIGNHKVYRMSAATRQERDDWLHCLLKVIRHEKVKELINGKLVRASVAQD